MEQVARVGIGYDTHRLVDGRDLVIGGIPVPFEKGLLGHSDGDVLCHAIMDALLGALGAGDIGIHFPDTDPRWAGASSAGLLGKVTGLVRTSGFSIAWVDCVVIAEKPKLSPYFDAMKQALAAAGLPPERLSLKAKTNEGMGFAGRAEGIVAQAICLLTKA